MNFLHSPVICNIFYLASGGSTCVCSEAIDNGICTSDEEYASSIGLNDLDATPMCSATVSSVIYCDIRMLATQTESHASVGGTTPKGDSESS